MIVVAGIDPGPKSGVIAILGGPLKESPLVLELWKATPLDTELFLKKNGVDVAYLEKVGPMPKQGVRSVWNFAEHYGLLQGILSSLRIKTVLVTPKAWQTDMKCLSGGDKKVTKLAAERIFPKGFWVKNPENEMKSKRPTLKTSDAALIAQYGLIKESSVV